MAVTKAAALAWFAAGAASATAIGSNKLVSSSGFDKLTVERFIMAEDRTSYVIQQNDGNLVQYTCAGQPIWATMTNYGASYGMFSIMQSDGNLVVYTSSGGAAWASSTQGGGYWWGTYWAEYEAVVENGCTFDIFDRVDDQEWQSTWDDTYNAPTNGCQPCDGVTAEAMLAARQIPPPESWAMQWWRHLKFLAWFYHFRLLLAAAVVAAAATAWRARRRGKALPGDKTERAPLLTPAAYGSTAGAV